MKHSVTFTGLTFSMLLTVVSTAQTIESTSESTPHPGIRLVEGETSNPTTEFWAAYVSLCTDSVHVDASTYDGYSTSGSWGSSVGAELAVNGDFFSASPRLHVYGDAVAGGERWTLNRTGLAGDYSGDWYHQKYGWIAFGDDWVEHTNTEWVKENFETFGSLSGWKPREVGPAPPPGTKALVSGFPQLVIDGEARSCADPTSGCFPDRSDMHDRHPRTAMGLTRDRQTFILAVVDGRRSSSVGMYGAELARLMKDLGAHTAFNLDGGGSTQMWVRGEGTVNRPSDGTPRGVVNHWGIFAGGDNGLSAIPGHCDNRWDGLVHGLQGQTQRTADLDGDGRGDACIRTPSGVRCALFRDGEFDAIDGPELADDSGWDDPSNYATMRWGDVDGDGRTDLCARANAGIRCWPSTGDGFGESIVGPALNDESGFHRPMYYSTIRLLDFTGDGLDDLCARWGVGVRCYASTGDGFSEAIDGPGLSNDGGWDVPEHYGTIRTGDVNGDGLDDICARANRGVWCWTSTGDGFSERIDGPEWSNANGWDAYRYWSTIRLIDLDGDARSDICGRGRDGLDCHLSMGDQFGPPIHLDALSDDSGWRDYSNLATLRFADVTGDGLLDACARANAGYRCWPFDGSSFGAALTGPLRDESGWTAQRFHRTADFVDLDADGRADLCARASAGLVCWRSTGDGFEEELVMGPAWSDDAGFGAARYYSTMRLLGAVRPAPDEPDEGDSATPGSDVSSGSDGGTTARMPDAGAEGDGGRSFGEEVIVGDGGCSCRTASPTASDLWLLVIPGLLLALRLSKGPAQR